MTDRWFSKSELADLLGVSPRTVQRYANTGDVIREWDEGVPRYQPTEELLDKVSTTDNQTDTVLHARIELLEKRVEELSDRIELLQLDLQWME